MNRDARALIDAIERAEAALRAVGNELDATALACSDTFQAQRISRMRRRIADYTTDLTRMRSTARPRAPVIQLHDKPWPHAHTYTLPHFPNGDDAA